MLSNRTYDRSMRRGLPRAGYTLVELLVVVMIVLILIAAALPVAKSVMESNRTREASRQLNTHLAMARAYAARNNRPFGLWMEYDQPIGGPATVRQVTRIYLAEVQPPWSGGTTSSRGIIRVTGSPPLPEFVPLDLSDTDPTDGVNASAAETGYLISANGALIEEGETFLVKFDFKGDWYRCIRGKATPPNTPPYTDPARLYYIGPVSSSVAPPAYNNQNSYGFRFQILREPRRVGNPLELSAGTCVDIEYSGFGPTGTEFGGFSNRLVLLFQPGGSVDGLYLDNTATSALGTLHFLIGRVEKVNPPLGANATHISGLNMFDLATSNLADPNSFWVSVGRLNGSITTSENFPDADHGNHPDPWTTSGQLEYLEECRALATGRELTGGQ
jgi:prepilin-type N-terminal cleavage/methylation domain-containing protein